jgi:hypothetical protein
VFTKFGVRIAIEPEWNKTSLGGMAQLVWVAREGTPAWDKLKEWSDMITEHHPDDLLWGTVLYQDWLQKFRGVGLTLGLAGTSTHSLRAGGCTDLLEGGAAHEQVKRVGRCSSDFFLQYLRPKPAEIRAHLSALKVSAFIQLEELAL